MTDTGSSSAGAPAPWPGCVPGCECARTYEQRPMSASGGRLLVSPAALRLGDAYLVVRPGRIVEAVITDLFIPQANPCCRAGERVVNGQRGIFWVEPGYVILTRRDPVYDGWSPDRRPTPDAAWRPGDALAFSPWRFRSAFHSGNATSPHGTGSFRRTRDGRTDWAAVHAEHGAAGQWDHHAGGGWDNFGRARPEDGQEPYFPWLVRAQTACPVEDLGEADDIGPRSPHADRPPGYICRLGHVHRGKSPYGRELPPEVAARISASLGEEQRPAEGAPMAASRPLAELRTEWDTEAQIQALIDGQAPADLPAGSWTVTAEVIEVRSNGRSS